MTKLNSKAIKALENKNLHFEDEVYISLIDTTEPMKYDLVIVDPQQVTDTLGITEEINNLCKNPATTEFDVYDYVEDCIYDYDNDKILPGLE